MAHTGYTTIEVRDSYGDVTREMVPGIQDVEIGNKAKKVTLCLVKAHEARECTVQDETSKL